jgi:hypothetical protein
LAFFPDGLPALSGSSGPAVGHASGQAPHDFERIKSAADGMHLWSERYDREMEDLSAIQDEIAAAIVGELKLRFAPETRPRRQPNLHAYEAYPPDSAPRYLPKICRDVSPRAGHRREELSLRVVDECA